MNKFILLLLLLLLSDCGRHKTSSHEAFTAADLQSKSELYLKLVSSHQDEHGFIMTDTCDSTFFSGLLAAAAPQLKIDISAAQNEQGSWFRRPTHDCGPSMKNSRSTVSRDMMLGVMWYMWRNHELQAAETLFNQLRQNNYILIGEGTAGELTFIPSYMNTLSQIIYRLGGARHEVELALPAIISEGDLGFEAHLTVWHILLRGELLGSIPTYNFNILQKYVELNPENPLFQAAYHKYLDGNYSSVLQLLMNSNEWPADKLPTSHNHCDSFPVQREYSDKNWGSCNPEIEHSGAEVPIIYYLILQAPEA